MKKLKIFVLLLFSVQIYGQTGIVSGFVTDSSSGEALIGANVILLETGQGMATDINGYYIIQTIPRGKNTVMVSYVGFDTFREELDFTEGESKKLNIQLSESIVELTEVEVSAEKLQRRNNIQPSKINLSPRMMKAAPALAELIFSEQSNLYQAF